MTNNAQWWIKFDVTMPDGRTLNEMVSLASPDLVNTAEAHRRARKTAQARLIKQLEKRFKFGRVLKAKIVCTSIRCVG